MIQHDVFISYKSQYVDIVKAVSHVLEEENIRCWYAPRDLDRNSAGIDYDDSIFQAISACRIVVVILTDEALDSEWVKTEIAQAQSKRKLIIPYVVGEITRENGLLMRLQQKHWIDAYPNPERKFSLLVNNVKLVLNEVLTADPGKDTTMKPFTVTPEDFVNDFDLEEGEALYEAKEYNEAVVALAASAERGNPKARTLICKLFFDLDKSDAEVSKEVWDMLERQAKAGYCYACFAMHTKYYRDYGNYYISFDYLKKAVREQNIGYAFLRLGVHYAWGMGVNQNYVLAVHYYERALKLGCTRANFFLGQQYEFGSDKYPVDMDKALGYYRKGAEESDLRSFLKLGDLYSSDGGRVKKDKDKAFEYYQKMVDQGDYRGWARMGLYFQIEGDQQTAVEYYKKAAQRDVEDAFSSLAMICWNEGEKEDAYRWAKSGYVRKDSFSAYLLGWFYEQDEDYPKAWDCFFCRYEWCGSGVEDLARLYVENKYRPEKTSIDDIVRMLDVAARGRNEEAVNFLIGIYADDEFGCKNPAKVEEYQKMGATVEMADRMYDYGRKLMDGEETTFNPYKGLELIEKAAKKDYNAAVEYLLKVYESGPYQDTNKHLEWCRKAVDCGSLDSTVDSVALKTILDAHFNQSAVLTEDDFAVYAAKARDRVSHGRNGGQPLRRLQNKLDPEFDPRQVEDGSLTEGALFEKYYDYFWAYDMDLRSVRRKGPEFWEWLDRDKSYAEVLTLKAREMPGLTEFWEEPNVFFDCYLELCQRYSITPQSFTRIKTRDVLPFVSGRVAEQFGDAVVRCMVSLFASGQGDILKCRQPIADEQILDVAEQATDDTVQLLLIGYVECRFEIGEIIAATNRLYGCDGKLKTCNAADWLNSYRERLTELGIAHDLPEFDTESSLWGPRVKAEQDTDSDAEFDRLMDDFISAELGTSCEATV